MGLLLIFGPSGAGKTRVIKLLETRNGLTYISPDITRPNREKESDKINISADLFRSRNDEGYYIFVNELFDSSYGTPRHLILEALSEPDFSFVLDFPIEFIDKIDGLPGHKYGIIIMPPSKIELEKRLRMAQRESRIPEAKRQYDYYLSMSESSNYDFIERTFVINNEIENAYNAIISLTKLKLK